MKWNREKNLTDSDVEQIADKICAVIFSKESHCWKAQEDIGRLVNGQDKANVFGIAANIANYAIVMSLKEQGVPAEQSKRIFLKVLDKALKHSLLAFEQQEAEEAEGAEEVLADVETDIALNTDDSEFLITVREFIKKEVS